MTQKISKSIVFLGLLLLTSFQYSISQNNLRLLSSNGLPFKVWLNEKTYNHLPQAEVLLENIKVDTLLLKFEFENKQKLTANFFLLNKGKKDNNKEYFYIITQKAGELVVDFKSLTDVIEKNELFVPMNSTMDSISLAKMKQLGHFCELKNEQVLFYNNLPNKGLCLNAMPQEYLVYAEELMKKNQLPNQKLWLAEEVCKNNCLNVKQLKTIINSIENELDKLFITKIAYFNLVDTIHKNELRSSFKFETSLKELNYFFNHSQDLKNVFGHYCNQISTNEEVNDFIKKELELSNDSYRLDYLKKRYYYYCFSIVHVTKILDTYTHDREKLEAAKLLYFKCGEKTNYRSLLNSFSFQVSAKNLEDFLKKQAPNQQIK